MNLSIWPKTYPFPNFAPLNDVRAYIAWSWKTTLITWIFYEDDIQLQIQVPPQANNTETCTYMLQQLTALPILLVLQYLGPTNQGWTFIFCHDRWIKLSIVICDRIKICKEFFLLIKVPICLSVCLTGGNWQKWKRVFLTCPCHKIYRDEAVGLKSCKNTWKITIFMKMWNLGQYRENLIFCQ